jgi:hypothetical protein
LIRLHLPQRFDTPTVRRLHNACYVVHKGVNGAHSNSRSALLTRLTGFLPQDIAEIGSSLREGRAGASRIRAFLEK